MKSKLLILSDILFISFFCSCEKIDYVDKDYRDSVCTDYLFLVKTEWIFTKGENSNSSENFEGFIKKDMSSDSLIIIKYSESDSASFLLKSDKELINMSPRSYTGEFINTDSVYIELKSPGLMVAVNCYISGKKKRN